MHRTRPTRVRLQCNTFRRQLRIYLRRVRRFPAVLRRHHGPPALPGLAARLRISVRIPPRHRQAKRSWDNPGPDARRRIAQHVTLEGFRSEFRGELPDVIAGRISLEDQPSTLDWFSKEQAYLLLETHLDEVVPLVERFLSHLGESNS